jgi:hypothetical protein
MSRHILLTSLLLAGSLAAQNYVVSPLSRTNTPGGQANTIPFWYATSRYQQIHGDLKGTPRVIQGLSLRKGGGNQASAVARTNTMTVVMCDSNFAASSTTFAANYTGTPITVLPSTTVNLPDWTTGGGSPAPWTLHVPFTVPFPYIGQNDLLWEWQVHATTSIAIYSADAYNGSSDDVLNATFVTLGSGCTATGAGKPMTQSTRLYSTATTGLLSMQVTTSNAPASVPASVWVGPVNPNLTIPGLCTTLHSTGLWAFSAMSSSTGQVALPLLSTTHDPNWAGLKLYLQTLAIDTGQPGLPFALSQGQEATLPGLGPGPAPIQRIYATSDTATTGSKETYSYGLVTRFTY